MNAFNSSKIVSEFPWVKNFLNTERNINLKVQRVDAEVLSQTSTVGFFNQLVVRWYLVDVEGNPLCEIGFKLKKKSNFLRAFYWNVLIGMQEPKNEVPILYGIKEFFSVHPETDPRYVVSLSVDRLDIYKIPKLLTLKDLIIQLE